MNMSAIVQDILNQLRTATFAPDGRTMVLAAIDQIEAELRSRENDAITVHSLLANAQQTAERQRQEIGKTKQVLEQSKHEHEKEMARAKQKFDADMAFALQKIALLEEKIRLENAQRFGRKSERWLESQQLQASLFNEIEIILAQASTVFPETVQNSNETTNTQRKKRKTQAEGGTRQGGRSPLPANLPRLDVKVDIPESEKVLDGVPLEIIGQEISERLQYKAAEFYVERTIRDIYGLKGQNVTPRTAPMPQHLFPKSILGPSIIASIITLKFCDGIPLYRQESVYERMGISLCRQTMARGAGAAYEVLSPLRGYLVKYLPQARVLHMDETPVRVLHDAEGNKRSSTAYMWVRRFSVDLPEKDGRPPRQLTIILYDFGEHRDSITAAELLGEFSNTLMTDGYSSYNKPGKANGLRHAACMAHTRRKFMELLKIDPHNPHAEEIVSLIQQLYMIEREIAGHTPDQILEARQTRSRLVMDDLYTRLIETARIAMPSGKLAKAIDYALKLWSRLEVFLKDPYCPIDNNAAERAIKPFVIGRNNWKFFDQHTGAKIGAFWYSLIETAKANGLEPMHYLNFLFRCYEKFGPGNMPWEKLLPTPAIRDFAESIGLMYQMI
jgi:transposase